MKKTLCAPAILFTMMAINSQHVSALEPLTKEELVPFCSNQMLWGYFNLSADKCMEAAVPCSKETSQNETDIEKATKKLMICIMKKNDIAIPDFSE